MAKPNTQLKINLDYDSDILGFINTFSDNYKIYGNRILTNEEYNLITDDLMKFVNYEGINVCSGKKQSKISSLFNKIFN